MKKQLILIAAVIFCLVANAHAARIKDMAAIQGIRTNQLVGYGLVVGLNGTGDKSGTEFTLQSLVNMMERMGVLVDKDDVKVKNVAAVMVTAHMRPFARIGSRMDVMVSSIGDAKSLVGGTLLMTPLKGVDGNTYALAQGAVSVGGVGAGGAAGTVTKNHLLVARIARGATVEREIPVTLNGKTELTLNLHEPDFTTARRMTEAINARLGAETVRALDSGTLRLHVPDHFRQDVATFIATIESLDVNPDTVARIVVNEKTGTVVIGENVRISTIALSHGNLSIVVNETPQVSQPEPFAEGETVVVPRTDIEINEQDNRLILVHGGSTIGELVRALNAVGVTPRDLISIFQSIKAAGALQAELDII